MITPLKRTLAILSCVALVAGGVRADITTLYLNSSADLGAGYGGGDTIGGNNVYNVYLSQDNGVTFLNSGDGPTTSIDLAASTTGTFTYQFYYLNSWAHALTLQLWSGSQPAIVVSTQHDTLPTAFQPVFDPSTIPSWVPTNSVAPGSMQATIGGYLVTLREFEFSNGSGPADAFSVTPGASITPEILGHFTYEVEPVPEPKVAFIGLLGLGLVGICYNRRTCCNRQSAKNIG